MSILDHKTVGIIGLGKMGKGIALQLAEKGWNVIAYNRTSSVTDEIVAESNNKITPAYTYEELVSKLPETKVVWVMVPSGDPVKEVIEGDNSITRLLKKGDYIIDGGNTYFKDTIQRYEIVESMGVNFTDVGVSGGPGGARNGACMMIGGKRENFEYLEELFKVTSLENGYQFFDGNGAGHFVKMVHNGIEYGMMQAIAEGFDLMKQSHYDLDLINVARIYENGSVIESSLITWMRKAFEQHTAELNGISKTAGHLGEGEWTIKTAKEMNIPVKVIEDSFQSRLDSVANPNYQAQIISALRNQFGGHDVSEGAK